MLLLRIPSTMQCEASEKGLKELVNSSSLEGMRAVDVGSLLLYRRMAGEIGLKEILFEKI